MSTQHTRSYEQIFSFNKQSQIRLAIADARLNKQRSIRTFAPIREERNAIVSNQAWFGKGHSHATFFDIIQKSYVVDAQERSATNIESLFAIAYVLGNNVVTQPDSAGNPNEFLHTFTWQDLATNKEVLYTTLLEIMGSEYTKRLGGAWISEFTLTGNRDDHVVLSFAGGGRKYTDRVLTSPGLTDASFFKTLFGTVAFGLADAPLDISVEVLSWELTVNQNPQMLFLMGESSGDEGLLSEVLIGDQTAAGNVVIKINKDHRDRFLNDEITEFVIVAKSPDLIDTNQHELTITLPNVKLAEEGFSEEGQTVAYTLTFTEESTLRIDPDEHLIITVLSDQDGSELLVPSTSPNG